MKINLLERLLLQKNAGLENNLYENTQIKFAYNSNKLSEKQVYYIYKTNSIDIGKEAINVDDIRETNNHFELFDYMLDIADAPISEKLIKEFHYNFEKIDLFKDGNGRVGRNIMFKECLKIILLLLLLMKIIEVIIC